MSEDRNHRSTVGQSALRAHRVHVSEGATHYDDVTLATALSTTHDAGQAITQDKKHVEASTASRSGASIVVAACAFQRCLVHQRATSCAPSTP